MVFCGNRGVIHTAAVHRDDFLRICLYFCVRLDGLASTYFSILFFID